MNNKISITKGNIPIDNNLLNKYSNVKEIFEKEVKNPKNKKIINIKTNIPELNNISIYNLKSKEVKKLAYDIFIKYNSKSFKNNGNQIIVSRSGIDESVEKIFNSSNQRNLLKEHLSTFSKLGNIIENAYLVNQTKETKNRRNINFWNYYYETIIIDNEVYYFEFDVRSLESGENQYRVQRIEKNRLLTLGTLIIISESYQLLSNLLLKII